MTGAVGHGSGERVIYLQDPNKLSYNVAEACRALGLGRTKLYELIHRGEIEAKTGGGRTLILRSEAERWLAGLPRAAAA
jgi:excisionase family DNA binding protein